MQEPIWIREFEVLALHLRMLSQFGGSEGVRDAGLLEFALSRPKDRYAYSETPSNLAELAAAYTFWICRNHPFVDGNKRTAMIVSFLFIEFNGEEVTATQEEAYLTFFSLAAGKLSEEELANWFTKNITSP
jgi:death-on-curing protein